MLPANDVLTCMVLNGSFWRTYEEHPDRHTYCGWTHEVCGEDCDVHGLQNALEGK